MELLDALGERPDPLTGRVRDDAQRRAYLEAKRAVGWDALPMYLAADSLADAIRAAQVTLLVAGTGAGKTVIAPRLAHALLRDMGLPGKVAVSNPKRITTESNARTAAFITAGALGETVGYRYRGSPAADGGGEIVYATDGHLLAVSRSGGLSDYGLLMVDEVHEHSLPTDFLLLQARREAARRKDMRVLVVTATIGEADRARLLAWFRAAGLTANEVIVPGATPKPVQVRFRPPERPGPEYVREAAALALDLALEGPGSVVVFVPLVADTKAGCEELARLCSARDVRTACGGLKSCVRLFSGAPADGLDGRRVLFSTNVAESSITLPDLTAVVDTCLAYHSTYEPTCDADFGRVGRITRAQCLQRRGRVGRVAPGTCVHMISEREFLALPEAPPPAVQSSDLAEEAWSMLDQHRRWDLVEAEFAELLSPPQPDRVAAARRRLESLGLLRLHARDADHTDSGEGGPAGPRATAGYLGLSQAGSRVRMVCRRLGPVSLQTCCAVLSSVLSLRSDAVADCALVCAASELLKDTSELWLPDPKTGLAARPAGLPAHPSGEPWTLLADRALLTGARRSAAAALANTPAWGRVAAEAERIAAKAAALQASRGKELAADARSWPAPWGTVRHEHGLAAALLVSRHPYIHTVDRGGKAARRPGSRAAIDPPPGAKAGDAVVVRSVSVGSAACGRARGSMPALITRAELSRISPGTEPAGPPPQPGPGPQGPARARRAKK